MKYIIAILLAAVISGCATKCKPVHRAHTHSTPLNITGPVNVSGPVNVTGPVTVNGQAKPEPVAVAPRPRSAVPVARAAEPATVEGDGTDLELKKEDLSVKRETVSNGKVVLRKTLTSRQVTIPQQTIRQEYTVERVAGGTPKEPWGEAATEISIPLTRETATPLITTTREVVRVRKTEVKEDAPVTATLREEKLEVKKE